MNQYPEEVRESPRPVVALVGCSPLHAYIIKAFQYIVRPDADSRGLVPYHFVGYESPEMSNLSTKKDRPKEFSTPKGIIQGDWMYRQKNVIPAVIIALFNWTDEEGKPIDSDIVSQLDVIRKKIKGRSTKIILGLVQKRDNPGVEPSSDARTNDMRKRAEVDGRSIIHIDRDMITESVKRWSSHLFVSRSSFSARLDKILPEYTRVFYQDEARALKGTLERLQASSSSSAFGPATLSVMSNSPIVKGPEISSSPAVGGAHSSYVVGGGSGGQSNLSSSTMVTNVAVWKMSQLIYQIRYHFKIAYLAEFRRDNRTILKYYTSSYNALSTLVAVDPNMSRLVSSGEIKAVADLIHFMISRFHLNTNNINEALNQFQRHARVYKPVTGLPQIEYQHWAWLSRQYLVFGQMLENQIQYNWQNTNTLSLQHPAFYYQIAAKYAIQRKKVALEIGQNIRNSESFEKISNSREIKPTSSIEGMDYSKQEYVGQTDDHHREKFLFVLSPQVLEKEEKKEIDFIDICREMLVSHSSEILDLLHKAYDHYKSKSSRMALYTGALIGQERFASEKYEVAKKWFDRIAANYRGEMWWSLLANTLNYSLLCSLRLNLPGDFVNYSMQLLAPNMPIPIEEKKKILGDFISLYERAEGLFPNQDQLGPIMTPFTKGTFYAKSRMDFVLRLSSQFPGTIQFSRVQIQFNDSTYDTIIDDPQQLIFDVGAVKKFEFSFVTKERTEVKCTSVTAVLGGGNTNIHFLWKLDAWPTFKSNSDDPDAFVERTSTKVLAYEARLEITALHTPPALVGEYYYMQIRMKNKGESISRGSISFDINPPIKEDCFFTTEDRTKKLNDIPLEDIHLDEEFSQNFYFHTNVPLTRKIVVKVNYETVTHFTSFAERSFDVPVVQPFNVQCHFYTSHFSPINTLSANSIVVNQPFYLSLDVVNNAPFQLKWLQSVPQFQHVTCIGTSKGEDKTQVMHHDNRYAVWYKLLPSTGGDNIPLGSVQLTWQRTESLESSPVPVIANLEVPDTKISTAPFSIRFDNPSSTVLGHLFSYMIELHNHTDTLQEFGLSVGDNGAFLFAGDKQLSSLSIHPHRSTVLRYNLLPLSAGRQPLPAIHITSKRLGKELPQTKQPRYIFVSPSKGIRT
ncbi:hypothetical protein PROFUN_07983 [Planoprotostelium fungivorum]|uniref:Trafficking protein particle complex subunit 11 domain-containing protein n=1 Tax=Planoprotostelium fungivorum TaxID=1890364 RepID=A0A2P6MV90_9EUKA|nr:hypothetical protein PROFUN_07983 [Planoprotostelium fungivorum]